MKKKFKIATTILLSLVFFVCCNNNVLITDKKDSLYDKDLLRFIKKNEIKLNDSFNSDLIGLTIKGYENVLFSKTLDTYGRSLASNDYFINDFVLVDSLQNAIKELNVPDFSEIDENLILKIMNDFDFNSEEFIIENIEMITNIYQTEVSAFAINDIVNNFDESLNIIGRSAEDYSYTIGDDTITLAEVAACLKHPLSAAGILKQKDKAYELTEEYMNYSKKTDEKSDAFRHSVWNFVMAKQGVGTKSEKLAWAEDFATAHEKGAKYNDLASEMDLHNNKAGRIYYDKNTSKKYKTIFKIKIYVGLKEPSYDSACEYLKNKAINSTLVDKTLYTLEEGKKLIKIVDKEDLVHIKVDNKSYE